MEKDLKALAKDLGAFLREPGSTVACSFLNGRGQETYSFESGQHAGANAKPLTLLDHVGGNPVLACVGRVAFSPQNYRTLVKWIKVANGYFEDLAVPQMSPQDKANYELFVKIGHPILKRVDEVTATMLLPALADGQVGLVLDGKLRSNQWHKAMPKSRKLLPLPELAFVFGVSDTDLLQKAFAEYRAISNELFAKIREANPGFPAFTIPVPHRSPVKNGSIYFYPVPKESRLDPQIVPNAGLTSDVATLSLSPTHSTRLVAKNTLRVNGGPLSDTKRNMSAAVYFDGAAFVDLLSPWVEFGAQMAMNTSPNGQQGAAGPWGDISQQIQTVMEVLKVIRGYTSCTYIEDGKLVVHSEWVIKDL
jgi:hypothetical protein